ncbi:hypothetical protein BT69DRAFT_1303964 [Atractiella rhizophila]|nr:hypothetical protein BT69DRAFT_1303964 [Atractiella rhizophila]
MNEDMEPDEDELEMLLAMEEEEGGGRSDIRKTSTNRQSGLSGKEKGKQKQRRDRQVEEDEDMDAVMAMEEMEASSSRTAQNAPTNLFRNETPELEAGRPMQTPVRLRSPVKFKAVVDSEDEAGGEEEEEEGKEKEMVGIRGKEGKETRATSDVELEFEDDDDEILREMEEMEERKAQKNTVGGGEKEKRVVEMDVDEEEDLYA